MGHMLKYPLLSYFGEKRDTKMLSEQTIATIKSTVPVLEVHGTTIANVFTR